MSEGPSTQVWSTGPASEVFRVFLRLGLTSFGGPVAHLAYFKEEFVARRRWLDEAQFAQLLAICQFLPGPASSQMGFAIGLFRSGWTGALLAFVGFTLPPAVLMVGFALSETHLDGDMGRSAIHGLKLVAVVVVAHALFGMARQCVPDLRRAVIALGAFALITLSGQAWGQLVAIVAGAVLSLWLCRRVDTPATTVFPVRYGRRGGFVFLALFVIGLASALAMPDGGAPTMIQVAGAFYRAGALVFGGGHVVLPLLEQAVVDTGWVAQDRFVTAYGVAQSVPGPMFSLAAFLGADIPMGLPFAAGAVVAVMGVFMPGFLLLLAVFPIWTSLMRHPSAPRTMAGINAAVVGLLFAAFLDPILVQGMATPMDGVIAAVGLAMMISLRLSAIWIVIGCVGASMGTSLL
ncbi:chromate efflux transporter [Silanimonas algicola]